MFRTLGLDLSTKAGAVVVQENFKSPMVLYEQTWKAPETLTGMQRCSWMAEQLIAVVKELKPDDVVIEGYGFNSMRLVPSVEIGTVIRYFLWQMGKTYHVVAPNSVKKFASGHGHTAKNQILLAVYKRWGFEAQDDNTADAFALACIGMALHGKLGELTKPMKEVLKTLGKAA